MRSPSTTTSVVQLSQLVFFLYFAALLVAASQANVDEDPHAENGLDEQEEVPPDQELLFDDDVDNLDNYHHHSHFHALGTGSGKSFFENGSIPYIVLITKASNELFAREVIKSAADHIREKTCVNFHEISLSNWSGSGHYLTFRDNVASCSAGGTYVNYGGCGNNRRLIMHEMLHIIGIRHEQKRFDSARYVKLFPERIKDNFVVQYSPTAFDAHGEYDFDSIMHYPNYGFNNGNGDTYESARVDFGVGCAQLSKGDIDNIQFVSQNCYKDIKPRCRTSSPRSLLIGTQFNQTISFMALYKDETMNATVMNLPEGATVENKMPVKGSIYFVNIAPTANDAGKEFDISVTFKTADDQTVECKTLVRIAEADFVCNGIPSTSPSVCSGHGVCNSNVFPQCQCEAGYAGPWCEGIVRCPRDIAMDYEGSDAAHCLVPPDSVSPNYVEGVNGWAINGTLTKIAFATGSSMVRQPSEVSFLVNFIGKGRYYLWLSGGLIQFNIHNNIIGNVEINKWSFVRFAFDWPAKKYTVFVDGAFARSALIHSIQCSSITNRQCSINSIQIKAMQPNLVVQMDRIRLRCSASHIAATTNKELSGATLLFEPVQLTLTSPMYTWNSNVSDVCTATDPKVLEGAKYTASGKILTITIPAVGDKPQSPVTQYITCNPKPEHFGASSSRATAVEIAPDNAKVFAIKGLCPADEKFEHKDIKDKMYSQQIHFASPRPESIKFTIDVTATSFWEGRIRRSANGASGGYMIVVRLDNNLKRLTLSNYTNNLHLTDDRFVNSSFMSPFRFTVKLNWTTHEMTLTVLDLAISNMKFDGVGLHQLSHWFESGSANGNATVETTCPTGSTPAVEMPQLYDPKFVSWAPPEPTEAPTNATTSPPLTDAAAAVSSSLSVLFVMFMAILM